MSKIKVLHVVPGFLFGGIESLILDWYESINRESIQFDIVKVTPPSLNENVKKIIALGGSVFSVPQLFSSAACGHIMEMKKLVDHGGYNIIHAHSLALSYFPLSLGRHIRTRILHSHTTSRNPNERGIPVKKFLSAHALKYATDLFACSDEAGRWAFGHREFHVLKNDIKINAYLLNHSDRESLRNELGLSHAFVVGNIGRLSTQKNLFFLIRIFKEIHKRLNHARLVLVGDGELRDELRRFAEKLDIIDAVVFAGWRAHVAQWLSAMDVFLFPTLFEGFGIAALEAQANGLPCVVSDTVPRSVKISDSVEFLSLNDSPEVWAERVIRYAHAARLPGEVQKIIGNSASSTVKWLEKFYVSRGSR